MCQCGIAPNLFILTLVLTAGLAGCESVTYVRSQLEEIPMPSPALLQPVSEPDCAAGHSEKVRVSTANVAATRTDANDFEQLDAAVTKRAEAIGKKKNSEKTKDKVEKLNAEINCYRNAADQMRRRIKNLQNSASETVTAVTNLKNRYQYLSGPNSNRGISFMMPAPGNY